MYAKWLFDLASRAAFPTGGSPGVGALTPPGRFGSDDDPERAVVYLASGSLRRVTAQALGVGGGMAVV